MTKHETAFVHPSAELGEFVYVGPLSIVDSLVRVGEATKVAAQCYLGPNVVIGSNCTIGVGVSIIGNVHVGDNVSIGHKATILNTDDTTLRVGNGAVIEPFEKVTNDVPLPSKKRK